MRKSAKQRDQKKASKARKKQLDTAAAKRQQEQYDAGYMRAIERERESMRRKRMQQFSPFSAVYGGALQMAAMEKVIESWDKEAALGRNRLLQLDPLKRGW